MEYVVDVTSANVGKLVLGCCRDGFELLGRVGFETVYRVDMGGSSLFPKDDPFWRKWDSDEEFLVNPAAARNCGEESGVHWWRREEKVVVGRRRYGGVMVVEEIEWKMKKRLR
ncbi:hypothetical protein Tco_1398679 [Tanacetum coccineum]